MVTGRRIRRVRARRAQVEPAGEKEANDVKR